MMNYTLQQIFIWWWNQEEWNGRGIWHERETRGRHRVL